MSKLLEIIYEARPVAWIDSKGDFTCKNKKLMVKVLRDQGRFWLAVEKVAEELKALNSSREAT